MCETCQRFGVSTVVLPCPVWVPGSRAKHYRNTLCRLVCICEITLHSCSGPHGKKRCIVAVRLLSSGTMASCIRELFRDGDDKHPSFKRSQYKYVSTVRTVGGYQQSRRGPLRRHNFQPFSIFDKLAFGSSNSHYVFHQLCS